MKQIYLIIILCCTHLVSEAQSGENYMATFMKPGIPACLDEVFNGFFNDKKIETQTAEINTGTDTLFGYFGEVNLIQDQRTIYYAAIALRDSLLSCSIGMMLKEDSLGYNTALIELGLSRFTTESVKFTIKYNPESKTVLYTWNNFEDNMGLSIQRGNINKGMKMPDMDIEMIDGTLNDNKKLEEKIVVVNWWHTRCGPCIAEMTALNNLVEFYNGRDDIVFIAICNSERNELLDFLAKTDFKYRQGIANDSIREFFGEHYPQHIIVNKEGKIESLFMGGSQDIGRDITSVLNQM